MKKDNWYPEVTTRYYRDPRVILGMKYDHKIDIHSLLCTLHEIKTGNILYNPDNLKDEDEENDFSLDYYHILLLYKDGLISDDWIKYCPKEDLREEIKYLIKSKKHKGRK